MINNYFTLKKEERLWGRQQDVEEKKWNRDKDQTKEEKAIVLKEQVATIYQECIHKLSLLDANEQSGEAFKITDEKRVQLIEEAHKFLSLISLRTGGNSSFNFTLRNFTTSPDKYAQALRGQVIDLAANEDDLPLISKPKIKDVPKEIVKSKKGEILFSLSIDNDFRKEQIIEGFEVPDSHAITLNLSDLTKEQRTLLADIYFDKGNRIPDRITLIMPDESPWKAKLDPSKSEAKDFIEQWRTDYEQITNEQITPNE